MARINVRLPDAPEFDNAAQVGNSARVQFNLPAILRLGVEVAPRPTSACVESRGVGEVAVREEADAQAPAPISIRQRKARM